MIFLIVEYRSSVKLLNSDDVLVDDQGFPELMTRDNGDLITDWSGKLKVKFDRRNVHFEENGKVKTRIESARDSNKFGGLDFRTDLIKKIKK